MTPRELRPEVKMGEQFNSTAAVEIALRSSERHSDAPPTYPMKEGKLHIQALARGQVCVQGHAKFFADCHDSSPHNFVSAQDA